MRNNVRNNDAMTGNGREALRIPGRGAAPAPHPAPAAVPEIEAAAPHPRAARTKFRDERAAIRGTPTHVRGRACAWGMAERASLKAGDLPRSEPAARRKSGSGKKGLWGGVMVAVIPYRKSGSRLLRRRSGP
ncbi:MAG: hypothetical protein LBB61_06395 [Treponema sp.]|nr:hypothetical protein [Treponema sp.]